MKTILSILCLIFVLSCTPSHEGFTQLDQDEVTQIKAVFKEFIKKRETFLTAVQENLHKIKQNIRVPEVSLLSKMESHYTEDTLFPIFPLVIQQICEHNNEEIFEEMMYIMELSSGSAAEDFADVMGGIYVCRADFLLDYIANHKEYRYLIREVDFGFLNYSYRNKEDPRIPALQAKLDSLNTVRPFR